MDLNHRHTDFQSVALPTELPALWSVDPNIRSKHAETKHGVIYIRQTPVARKLQENSGIFSDDRQETPILQISGARGSGFRIDRERVHFALGVGITLVLVVVEEAPESLDSVAIGTKLSVLGGPEELVAALGCPGLYFQS